MWNLRDEFWHVRRAKYLANDDDAGMPMFRPGDNRTCDPAAKESCFKVACGIAGETPPAWFVQYLEEQVVFLAANRLAEPYRRKERLQQAIREMSRAIADLLRILDDAVVCDLLEEKQFIDQQAIVEKYVKGKFDTKSADDLGGRDYVEEFEGVTNFNQCRIELRRGLHAFEGYANYASKLRELKGSGPGKVYLKGNVSPRQRCAFIICISREYFKCSTVAGRAAFANAEELWSGTHTSLNPLAEVDEKPRGAPMDALGAWRQYFAANRRKLHFVAFESCRLGFGMMAHVNVPL